MPLKPTGLGYADRTGIETTIRIQATTSKLQSVYYGLDSGGNPVRIPVNMDLKSFSVKILAGNNQLQLTVSLQGFPSDTITIQEVFKGTTTRLDEFIANPGSLIWSPIIQGN